MAMKRSAPKSCIPCRDRKRKCDRATPSCGLCYRLGRVCGYPPTSPSRSRASSETSNLHQVNLHQNGDLFSNTDDPSNRGVHRVITDRLSKAVGNVSEIRAVSKIYFSTIHHWLPVVSESLFYERLSMIFLRPRADQSLLCMGMALINLTPPAPDDLAQKEQFESLYTLVKTSVAILEAADLNSIEVVQARLLVTLFEVGHGLSTAGYISMAALARAAATLGINETINAPSSPKCEEGLRVWWGIVMLDRFITIERGSGLCATEGLGSPQHLPRDSNVWDQKIIDSLDPLPMSTPSSVRVGPFARQAQISHVTNLLINHLRAATTLGLDSEESDQLARTLLSFSMLFPEETPQPWPRYCGAIGMCYSSLMMLHKSRSPSPLSTEFLELTFDRMNSVSCKFNARIDQVDVRAISPFPPHSLHLVALVQDELWRETWDPKRKEDREESIRMLRFFGRRWGNAGKYMATLEKQITDIPA